MIVHDRELFLLVLSAKRKKVKHQAWLSSFKEMAWFELVEFVIALRLRSKNLVLSAKTIAKTL